MSCCHCDTWLCMLLLPLGVPLAEAPGCTSTLSDVNESVPNRSVPVRLVVRSTPHEAVSGTNQPFPEMGRDAATACGRPISRDGGGDRMRHEISLISLTGDST